MCYDNHDSVGETRILYRKTKTTDAQSQICQLSAAEAQNQTATNDKMAIELEPKWLPSEQILVANTSSEFPTQSSKMRRIPFPDTIRYSFKFFPLSVQTLLLYYARDSPTEELCSSYEERFFPILTSTSATVDATHYTTISVLKLIFVQKLIATRPQLAALKLIIVLVVFRKHRRHPLFQFLAHEFPAFFQHPPFLRTEFTPVAEMVVLIHTGLLRARHEQQILVGEDPLVHGLGHRPVQRQRRQFCAGAGVAQAEGLLSSCTHATMLLHDGLQLSPSPLEVRERLGSIGRGGGLHEGQKLLQVVVELERSSHTTRE